MIERLPLCRVAADRAPASSLGILERGVIPPRLLISEGREEEAVRQHTGKCFKAVN